MGFNSAFKGLMEHKVTVKQFRLGRTICSCDQWHNSYIIIIIIIIIIIVNSVSYFETFVWRRN